MRLKYYSLLAFLMLMACLSAQETIVVGQVLDSHRSPMQEVTVQFKDSDKGMSTNEEGFFMLRTFDANTTLLVSYLGYKKQEIKIERGQNVGIEIIMEEESTWLPEVFVLPGTNPALELMRKVRIARRINDTSNYPDYIAKNTDENIIFLSNANHRNLNKRIFEHLQSGNLNSSDSALLVPLYMSETTYQLTPKGKKEIEKNTFSSEKTAENLLISLSAELAQELNFYKNSVSLFGKSFISPLANVGNSFYNYYIIDSVSNNTGKLYELYFRSSNPRNLAFNGKMWIDSASLALTRIEAELPKKANINFVKNLRIHQEFEPFSGNLWTKKSEQLSLNMTYALLADSLHPKPQLLILRKSEINPSETMHISDNHFAQSDYSQEQIDEKMQTLSQDPLFKSAVWLADMLLTGYAKVGIFDVGQVQRLVRVTDIEGWRFTLPLHTNETLWKNASLGGHIGYGFKNKEVKYSAFGKWKLPTEKRRIAGLSYNNDYRRIDYDYNDYFFREVSFSQNDEDIISSVVSLMSAPKMNDRKEVAFSFENEWNSNIESSLFLRSIEQFPNTVLPFSQRGELISSVSQKSVAFTTRFSSNERTYEDHFNRIYIGSRKPVLSITGEYGQYNIEKNSGEYGKIIASLKHNARFDYGNLRYVLRADYLLGDVPYPLLGFMHGNETKDYNLYKFSSMEYMQYAADKSIQLHTEFSFNGLILNNIPLIKWLNLREICSFKIAYGSLRNGHKTVLDFPAGINPLENPYAEFGVGVTNILRVYSFQSIWSTDNLLKMSNIRWLPRFNFSISF